MITSWQQGGTWIIATKALGAGVDFANIRNIIHMGFGKDDTLMEYAQQSGRAGRDSRWGLCIAVIKGKATVPVFNSHQKASRRLSLQTSTCYQGIQTRSRRKRLLVRMDLHRAEKR
ncbi:hypothetical protein BDZ91DRAFT_533052 [Kalaharituber pfeilii]|nr:hypothetical protein BDZ91DRAFT_533052 [Kalaharituber pfeilii]